MILTLRLGEVKGLDNRKEGLHLFTICAEVSSTGAGLSAGLARWISFAQLLLAKAHLVYSHPDNMLEAASFWLCGHLRSHSS